MSGRAWLARATAVGLDTFQQRGVLALDCHVRRSVAGLGRDEVVAAGPTPRLGRELAHVLHVRPGDVVVATDSHRPSVVLLGRAASGYRFAPDDDPQRPHVCEVAWRGLHPRASLVDAGLVLPGISVAALAPLELPAAVESLVDAPAPAALSAGAGRLRRAPSLAPSPAPTGGVPVGDLLPRRLGRPASWADPTPDERVACDHPERTCGRHTRHRYLLEVALPAPDPQGPNVLVVGANPTCPDEPSPGNVTYGRVRALGTELGAASTGMVNLATRRTASVPLLARLPPEERVGPRQHDVLREAFARADLVVLAPGAVARRLLPDETAEVERLLAGELARGLVVVAAQHPRTWATARRAGPSTFVAALQPWQPPARGRRP